MNPELEFKTEEDKIKFQELLQEAFAKMNNYERRSIEIVLSLLKSVEQLKDNKLRMTKYIVEDIDKLIDLVRISNGKPEDIKKMMDEIKSLQSNVSRYMETSDDDVLESIKRNIKDINEINKVIAGTNKEELLDEEKKETNDLKNNELRYLNERQNKLHYKVDTEITKELRKLKSSRKPFDFKKLDKAYKNLYIALEKDDKEEIINKRGRLIRLLEANKKEINEQYKGFKPLEEIKEVFESEEAQEIKQQRINEILRSANNEYSLYFSNINNYDELRKEFYNLYEFLEVNKTRLYTEALREELKIHGIELKEAYGNELIDKKHQSSVLTQALPKTLGLSIQKFSNTMGELRNATTDRQRSEMRKEALKDIGRIVVTPVANVAKFAANNWYTLSLLHKGYKTAKAQAEQQVQTEEQETPEHHGAEYDDPEFEEEVIRLMKTGKYQSVDEAEHQALINLGRIPPDEPQIEQQETPEHHGAEYDDPEFEEEVAKLMKSGKYQSIDAAEHQALINLGRIEPDPTLAEVEPDKPGTPQETDLEVGDPDPDFTDAEESELDNSAPELEPESVETNNVESPVVEDPVPLNPTQQELDGAEVGTPVVINSTQNNNTYVAVKNSNGTFDVTEYKDGVVVGTYEGLSLSNFSDTFVIAASQELPAVIAEAEVGEDLNNNPNVEQNPAVDPDLDSDDKNNSVTPQEEVDANADTQPLGEWKMVYVPGMMGMPGTWQSVWIPAPIADNVGYDLPTPDDYVPHQ